MSSLLPSNTIPICHQLTLIVIILHDVKWYERLVGLMRKGLILSRRGCFGNEKYPTLLSYLLGKTILSQFSSAASYHKQTSSQTLWRRLA